MDAPPSKVYNGRDKVVHDSRETNIVILVHTQYLGYMLVSALMLCNVNIGTKGIYISTL